jgi:hypothetical protein
MILGRLAAHDVPRPARLAVGGESSVGAPFLSDQDKKADGMPLR